MGKISRIFIISSLFFLPLAVWAVDLNNLKVADVVQILNNIRDWFSAIVAVIAVIMMLYAAFLFITSGGDSDRLGTAKKTLTWAIVGIFIAFLAYGIVSLVGSFLGGSSGGGAGDWNAINREIGY